MPRTAGVSSNSLVRCNLFKPRPTSVAFWSFLRPIGLRIWVTDNVPLLFTMIITPGQKKHSAAHVVDPLGLAVDFNQDRVVPLLTAHGLRLPQDYIKQLARARRLLRIPPQPPLKLPPPTQSTNTRIPPRRSAIAAAPLPDGRPDFRLMKAGF